MINIDTLKSAPVTLLTYVGGGNFIDKTNQFSEVSSATTYWLYQDLGESYYLQWWGNGWVIRFQESYLIKELRFEHKNDIPSFEFSSIPSFNFNNYGDNSGWIHVYGSREEAVEVFKKYILKWHNYDN